MSYRRDVSEPVLFDILLFLPVISLLRFKTICKSWCSIIESSTFISQHLYHNSEENNLIFHSHEHIFSDRNGIVNKDQLFMFSGRKHEVCSNLSYESFYPGDTFDIVNSCNGIVCVLYDLSADYWRLSLWNPATKQMRQLPEASYYSPPYELLGHVFALGFDIKTNDYKIVSMSWDYCEELMCGSLVQVYNMRTDSWRTIRQGDDFPVYTISDGVACKSEIYSWIGSSNGCNVIFYFDFTDEVYGTMPLPDDLIKSYYNISLAFVDDKITCIEWIADPSSGYPYEIWVMNEFGMKESWNKSYTLKEPVLPWQSVCEVQLSKNGDFFLALKEHATDNKFYLYFYDIVTGEVKILDVLHMHKIINYNESLVSVKSTNRL